MSSAKHIPSVTILAFGRRGYGFSAHNAILSLRHHGYTGPIDLFITEALQPLVPDSEGVEVHRIQDGDPGWIKLELPDLIKRPTLYLDADVLALADITPLLIQLAADGRDFITSVQGTGCPTSKSIGYFHWAKPKVVGEKEGFDQDAPLYGIQSSWMFMRPGVSLSALGERARLSYIAWSQRDMVNRWGASKPDELFWGIACTAMQHDPTWTGDEPMWYGAGIVSHQAVRERYCLMTLPGQKQTMPQRAVQIYAAEARTIGGTKPEYIFGDKHANFKDHGMHKLRR